MVAFCRFPVVSILHTFGTGKCPNIIENICIENFEVDQRADHGGQPSIIFVQKLENNIMFCKNNSTGTDVTQ